MQNTADFTDRLKLLVGDEAVTSFADRAKISEGTLRNLLKGGDPKLSNALRIAEAGNTSLGWLVGEHEFQVQEAPATFEVNPFSEFDTVNLYDVDASAGHGNAVITEDFKLLYFRKEWFSSRGLTAANLVAVNVVGDSMEPDIPDESIVLVDTNQTDVKNGAVYVFTLNGDLLIKRMMATVEGYKAMSINPHYGDMDFKQDEAEKLNVIGRAVRALPDIKL